MSATQKQQSNDTLQGVILIGLRSSAAVQETLKKYPGNPGGYHSPIILVETDVAIAKRCISEIELKPQSRFEGCFGPNAYDELEQILHQRLQAGGLPETVEVCSPELQQDGQRVANQLKKLHQDQLTERAQLHAQVASAARNRRDEIVARLTHTSSDAKLRIMLVTTRHSTFIQHAIRDLEASFQSLGHETRTVIEEREHALLNPTQVLRQQIEFQPDLIVVANLPRFHLPNYFPDGIAHLCWVQDAASYLFQPFDGQVSDFDFIAGHTFRDSIVINAYPDSRKLEFPIPVSESKFHNNPVDEELRTRLSCDIAYVSHQSLEPETHFQNMLQNWPTARHALIREIWEWAKHVVNEWGYTFQRADEYSFTNQFGHNFDDVSRKKNCTLLMHQVALPLMERLIRHQTLEWVAEIAEQHNLDFRIYGRGWHEHPTLSKYAHGPLGHGVELRASYQSARVQLHASIFGVGHQRLHECVLSGGFMLARKSWSEVLFEHLGSITEYLYRHEPDIERAGNDNGGYKLDHHPELARILDERASLPPLGFELDDEIKDGIYTRYPQTYENPLWPKHERATCLRPIRLLADPDKMSFATRVKLEDLILKACSDDAWRQSLASQTADLTRDHLSMNTFARSVLEMIESEFQQTNQLQLHEGSR